MDMSNSQTFLEVERIEPYGKDDVITELTPTQLQAILKYFRMNPEFLKHPAKYPRTLNLIANDLKNGSFQKTSSEILQMIERWKARIGQLETSLLVRHPDRELKRLLTAVETRLTHSQITLIMQHLEVVGSDADGLWATIAIEMRAMKQPSRPEIYWRRSFDEWCHEAQKLYQENPDELTTLQMRYIEFATSRGELHDSIGGKEVNALELVLNHCRTCLGFLKAADPKLYLFEPIETGTTLADKINVCFGTGIEPEERLPKYACGKCIEKIEGAYELKMQIDRTDEELKSLIDEFEKRETKDVTVKNEHNMELEKVQGVESMVEDIEEGVHHEESEEEANEKTGPIWSPEDDIQGELVEQTVVNEEHDIENFEEMIESDHQYLEGNVQDDFIGVKPEKPSLDQTDLYSEEFQPKEISPRNQIVKDIKNEFYQCTQCKVVLRSYELWKVHKDRHHSEKRYTCETCSKQFRSSSTLKVHQRTHTNERPYVCEICDKRFVQSTNLIYHMKVHQGIRDYPCEQCSYKARNQNDLNLHKRSHTGARPYVCEHCKCLFSTSSNLSKHVKRRHTGERKFQICSKAFRTYSHMKAHCFVHNREHRPVKCDHCPYRTSTKSSLSIHMKSHVTSRPYVCQHCKMGFRTSSNMHKHVRNMHEKQRPFKCEQCDKTFNTKETVQKHMVTHTGTKPYTCPKCNFAYGWYNGLQKHMKSVHPGVQIPTEKSMIVAMSSAKDGE